MYGGGITCLKELLANADDAKATHLTVCLDKSQYQTDGLLSDGMAVLQGLALWVCNNAKFSSTDWENYTRNVGESAKANDSETIGEFGKGALTAYSLGDVIQLLSGDCLLTLDPHGTHLPDQLESIFGNLVDPHDKHFVNVAHDHPGQLHPFMSFTNTCPSVHTLAQGKHYPGTLFRLALRTQSAAQVSRISGDSFTADSFLKTLSTFIQIAPDLLLFTRHVKHISVYVKEAAEGPCKLIHECAAKYAFNVYSMISTSSDPQSVSISIQDANETKTKRVWVKSTHPATAGRPGGGVAVLLQDDSSGNSQTLPTIAGLVYSIMALPLERTGLPVHINGGFRMSSDRRTLWTGEGNRGQVSYSTTLQKLGFECAAVAALHSSDAL